MTRRRLTLPGSDRAYWLIAAAVGWAAGCTVVEGEPPARPRVEQPAPAAMSAHVPTFDLSVDEAEFARMSERYLEDIKVDARLTLWRGGELVGDREAARIQVKGFYSAAFPQKPLGVRLDRAVDNASAAWLRVPHVGDGQTLDRLRTFRLRNGGNDFTGTLLKDLAYARLLARSGLDVLPVYGEPAACYVNGDFYGLANLRSETNGRGVAGLLGIDRDRLRLAELDGGPTFIVKEGDAEFFRRFEQLLQDGDREGLRGVVDEDSFIDFVLVGTVFAVWDWPWKNVRVYAVDGGPLRFVSYDFDLASEQHVDYDPVRHMRQRRESPMSQLFEVLYADEAFRVRFEDRYAELIREGWLAPERLRVELEALAKAYRPLIDFQTARHGHPSSPAEWQLDLERVVEEYEERYAFLEPY